jgi:hypothetical protein
MMFCTGDVVRIVPTVGWAESYKETGLIEGDLALVTLVADKVRVKPDNYQYSIWLVPECLELVESHDNLKICGRCLRVGASHSWDCKYCLAETKNSEDKVIAIKE